MIFCPHCGTDRRTVAPIAPCPACGGAGVAESGPAPLGPPATPTTAPPARVEAERPPPVTPSASKIAWGIVLAVLSAWLVFSWIPSKRPLSAAEALAYIAEGAAHGDVSRASEWRFNRKVYPWAYVVAILIGVAGIKQVVDGATYRPKARRKK